MRTTALLAILFLTLPLFGEQPDPWKSLELTNPPAGANPVEPVEPSATPTISQDESKLIARHGAPTASGKQNTTTSASEPGWLRSLLSLIAVVLLIGLLAWGYRAATGNTALPLGRPRRQGVIEVIARTSLGPRQSVCLVRCGPRMVLVGLSPDSMNALDVISDDRLVADLAGEQLRRSKPNESFSSVMQDENASYDEPDVDETRGAEESTLSAAKRGLVETIEKIRAAKARQNAR